MALHARWPLLAYYDFYNDRSAEELRRLVACKESDPSGRRELELQRRVNALDSTRLSVLKKPCTVIMRGFNQKKRHSTEWESAPFYTKPEGYKMCLSVDANGDNGDEEGLDGHVSVFFHLMWGDYDYNLEWPFQGSITVELLASNRRSYSHSETIKYDRRTPQECKQRVESGEVGLGFGYPEFIDHWNLKHYLKNDCLYFKVSIL